ncbi:pentatricopeptide repeat-containing protein At1g08070, chloroplastic-like [Amborella trichopoda]|uniref:pentatricopeptide repeat-containing protein At1g08070, chloroplastic-like n=1 Tax=Amborella trichopoda TaxID=13333 RepID=UPI0005D4484E|nr:pentatricopeptide repeat-containing protein At1g08070, chloroplastic-like [Amborella trichopoda]|eukprot:XP_011625373.1 pentatricopeptide repeat-containing protein At1g08070, chloroplastic-like [Amborella trichopoda]
MYARKVFDEMHERSPFSWTTMIAGYAKAGHAQEALNVFVEMRERGVKPSNDTMVSVLSACAKLSMEDSEKWRLVFSRKLCEGDVSRTALVYLYAKNGEIVKAWKVFDGILESERSVVAWNTMINGFVHSGLADEALALFDRMRAIGQIPNHLTMVSVLSACARVRALELGESITDYVTRIISREIFQTNAILATALIDMYAKCGQIDRARSTFEALRNKDVVSWNAMTMGLALHGQANEALMLFSKMETLGLRPNAMTFLATLCACAHSGLVERGCQFFEAMSRNYRITPGVEHYSCLVDLLGRNGRLDEAREVIRSMPIEPNALVWGALLGACIVHSRADLIEDCHRNLIELDPKKPANYVLLSNFYAFDGRWDDIANVRVLMKESGVRKEPGCSWIERGGIVQKFIHDSTKLHYRQVL